MTSNRKKMNYTRMIPSSVVFKFGGQKKQVYKTGLNNYIKNKFRFQNVHKSRQMTYISHKKKK